MILVLDFKEFGKQKAVGGEMDKLLSGLIRNGKGFIWRLATNVDEIGALVLKF